MLRASICAGVFAVALGLWSIDGRAEDLPQPIQAHGWCQFTDHATRTAYFTAMLSERATAKMRIWDEFIGFVGQRYTSAAKAAGVDPDCHWNDGEPIYVVRRAMDLEKSSRILQNLQVVDTGWSPH